jgi:hypothetical protein
VGNAEFTSCFTDRRYFYVQSCEKDADQTKGKDLIGDFVNEKRLTGLGKFAIEAIAYTWHYGGTICIQKNKLPNFKDLSFIVGIGIMVGESNGLGEK